MYKDSIVDLFKDCCTNFEEEQEKFLKNPKNLAEFVMHIRKDAIQLGISYIEETLQFCDDALRNSQVRKAKGWHISRRDRKTLITSLGEVNFSKTLFHNVKNNEYCYLIDQLLGFRPDERLTEDAEACLLEEAVQSSYRRGGESASLNAVVTKEAVKDKIHRLVFEEEKTKKPAAEKKVVDYLFIDADEDHVALQFREKKGDLEKNENGYKSNTEIAKLVYVYEGIEKESPHSRRKRLIAPHYFSGVYKGKENEKLWDEVYAYLDHTYDLTKVKKIYLGADGGAWIRGCPGRISGITYALDEFHLRKYLNKMTSHMLDSAEDARRELVEAICSGTKRDFRKIGEELLGYAEAETQKARIEEGMGYILDNWAAAKVRMTSRETLRGCSAEGHVSHVLSSRMSSRPMGWSRHGVDQMAHLRAYYYNGGDMLELVKRQPEYRTELKKAAGAEEIILSAEEIMRTERQRDPNGKYYDAIRASVTDEVSKWVWFNGHIWGL